MTLLVHLWVLSVRRLRVTAVVTIWTVVRIAVGGGILSHALRKTWTLRAVLRGSAVTRGRRLVWVGVGGVEEVVQGHQLPVASVHRQVPQERLPRGRAAARRPGVALRRLCAQPPPPSSSLSTPCGFP